MIDGVFMKQLLKALRPVKNRIRRNRFLRGAAAGLAAGLTAAVLLQAAAFCMPIPDRGLWEALTVAAVTLLVSVGNALRRVKNMTAAKAADACGLKERTVTALELEKETGTIHLLQRRDACEALEKLDVKRIRPGSVKKTLLAALGCAALLAVLLLVPNTQDAEAAARKALNRTVQEGWKKIEQAAREDEERLPDEKKSELRKITADLNRELGESRDAADTLVALDKAEQRLEKMREQTAGDAAAGYDHSGEAGETGGISSAEGKASGNMTETPGAGQAGASSASADTGTAAQLQTLQTVTALKSAVNPSLQAGNTVQGISGRQGTQNGAGTGNNGNQSGQNGTGPGESNNGNKAGGGAGEGTTNEEQQGSGSGHSGIVKGNRDPRYKEAEYETIYDPEHIGRSTQDVMTEQYRMKDEGSVQIETGPGKGNLDGDVPWSEALQEYADTEARAADRENLSMQERQWVEEYYRLLTEQQ